MDKNESKKTHYKAMAKVKCDMKKVKISVAEYCLKQDWWLSKW